MVRDIPFGKPRECELSVVVGTHFLAGWVMHVSFPLSRSSQVLNLTLFFLENRNTVTGTITQVIPSAW